MKLHVTVSTLKLSLRNHFNAYAGEGNRIIAYDSGQMFVQKLHVVGCWKFEPHLHERSFVHKNIGSLQE